MNAFERIESVILICMGLIGMSLWYAYWVKPHDDMRYAVMECMGDRVGEAVYQECHQQLSHERRNQNRGR